MVCRADLHDMSLEAGCAVLPHLKPVRSDCSNIYLVTCMTGDERTQPGHPCAIIT